MTVRLRNITNQLQTVIIVRPTQTIEHDVFPLNYLTLLDEEFPLINPPLVNGIWEITMGDALIPIAPPPSVSSFVTDGVNIGTGSDLFKQKVGTVLQFKRLVGGTNVTLSESGDDIIINSTGGGGGGGEANTASNASAGTGTGLVFKSKTGVDLVFRKLKAGANITLTNGVDDITIASSAPAASALAALNIGAAAAVGVSSSYAREDHVHQGVFAVKKSGDLALHGTVTLSAGTNVTLTQVGNDISIASSGGGAGEANTASNSSSGTGTGNVFKSKVGVDLVMKKIKAGTNVTITDGADDITIAASGGGSAATLTHRRVTTTNANDVQIYAFGLSADVAAITVVKTGNIVTLSTIASTCRLVSVQAYFSGLDVGANTNISIVYPEPNGATTLAESLLPLVTRFNATFNPYGTNSISITNSAGIVTINHTGGVVATQQAALKLVF